MDNYQKKLLNIKGALASEFKDYAANDLDLKRKLNIIYNFTEDEYPKVLEEFIDLLSGFAVFYVFSGLYDKEQSLNFKSYLDIANFEAAYELIKYEWIHGAISLTVSWKDYPKHLNRRILFPVRTTMGIAMVGILSALRVEGTHLACIYKGNLKLGLPIEDEAEQATDLPVMMFKDFKTCELHYDYGDSWCFTIKANSIQYLKENEIDKPFVIKSAKGFGIFEDNKEALINYIENGSKINFDFDNCDLKELKEEASERFFPMAHNYLYPYE